MVVVCLVFFWLRRLAISNIEGSGMDFDDVERLLDVLEDNQVTPQCLRVMIFLITPRRPQVVLDALSIDRGSLNKMVRRNSRFMSRRVLYDEHVSRGRGKLPIEYHLTDEGVRLLDGLVKSRR